MITFFQCKFGESKAKVSDFRKATEIVACWKSQSNILGAKYCACFHFICSIIRISDKHFTGLIYLSTQHVPETKQRDSDWNNDDAIILNKEALKKMYGDVVWSALEYISEARRWEVRNDGMVMTESAQDVDMVDVAQ